MCRFILYLGCPITLSSIITEPSHGLLAQSLHATCPGVTLNPDGFGISWYVPEISPIPGVFKDISPAWSNTNLRQLSRITKSGCIMAHVRAASVGAGISVNCHPFTYRNFTWMHNGTVSYFSKLKREILSLISDSGFELIKGTTDSEALFALFITNYEKEINYQQTKEQQEEARLKLQSAPQYLTHSQFEPEELPYPTIENNTQVIARVLKQTILQIHKMILKYELDNGILTKDDSIVDSLDDGASSGTLSITKTCAKLNLAVSDGFTCVASRYVTGPSNCAHTLYWSRGSSLTCNPQQGSCQVLKYSTSDLSKNPCLVVSSEPLSTDFKCEEVPVNHMVIGNGNGHFSIESIN
eukprot:gene3126-3908_t